MSDLFPSTFREFLENFGREYQRLRKSQGHGHAQRAGQRGEHDFVGHSSYVDGDDLRHVDWNVYGRNERFFLKIYQPEVSREVSLLLDDSRSMAAEDSKRVFVLRLSALLGATALASKIDLHLAFGGKTTSFRERKDTPKLLSTLEKLDFSKEESFFKGRLNQHQEAISRTKNLVLISDFLEAGEPKAFLKAFAQRGRELNCLATLSASELDPSAAKLSGALSLEDAESGANLDLHADAELLKRYRHQMALHLSRWQEGAHGLKAGWLLLNAGRSIQDLARHELFAAEGAWL